ncbi:LOW QUALITY PROTEIN: dehydrogenase/reductase SDR family member 12 [Podargus strigoides]
MKETKSRNFSNFQSSRMDSNSPSKVYEPRIQYKRQRADKTLDVSRNSACESTAKQALHYHQPALASAMHTHIGYYLSAALSSILLITACKESCASAYSAFTFRGALGNSPAFLCHRLRQAQQGQRLRARLRPSPQHLLGGTSGGWLKAAPFPCWLRRGRHRCGGSGTTSWYRNAVWFVKGLRGRGGEAASGYESAAKPFSPADVEVNVVGRSFQVTGAKGIGKATATGIARSGGTVHLVCRNKERAEVAKGEIVSETGNQNIFLHIVDMSNPKEVTFAEKFKNEHKLKVLISNAGCMVNNRELTEDRLEKNFATNSSGTYILTTVLLPLLKKEADARVITVSSGGVLVQKLNISDLQSGSGTFDGTMVYAQNKRQQVVLTEQWAKAHGKIHFSVTRPGADTPAVRSSMPDFCQKMKNTLRTEARGADTVGWLAVLSEARKLPGSLFFQDRQPVPTHLPLASTHSSLEDEEKLMEVLEDFSKFKSTSPGT